MQDVVFLTFAVILGLLSDKLLPIYQCCTDNFLELSVDKRKEMVIHT